MFQPVLFVDDADTRRTAVIAVELGCQLLMSRSLGKQIICESFFDSQFSRHMSSRLALVLGL